MSINWDDYQPYQPGAYGPLHELPRKEARQEFNQLMAERSVRRQELHRLLEVNGVTLGTDDAAIQRLDDWYREHVEPNPTQPGRLRNLWYAVTADIALFLGDVMIERHPNLSWQFFTWGKKSVSYQRHVIMGFTKVANPKYNYDFGMVLGFYGHSLIAGDEHRSNLFVPILAYAGEKA